MRRATAALAAVTALGVLVSACTSGGADDAAGPAPSGTAEGATVPPPVPSPADVHAPRLVPRPAEMRANPQDAFALVADTRVTVAPAEGADVPDAAVAEAVDVADGLATTLRRPTGYALPVTRVGPDDGTPSRQTLRLVLDPAVEGDEAYALDVTRRAVTMRASTPEGLFRATRTLLQLLPPKVAAGSGQPGAWAVPGVHVTDRPRFAWRGAMLDVARHFRTVDEVKDYVDLVAAYKLNVLHLHLTDDQGWRLDVEGWPRLTGAGAATEVGGGPGGSYTQQQYREIVRYAQERYVTVVPEIDMPGHTNAALHAYPQLTCDGQKPDPYTGTSVGFSTLCTGSPVVRRFVADVVRQVSALTPGPYVHVGGDEAQSTRAQDYRDFLTYVEKVVRRHDKTPVGWAEVADAGFGEGTVVQHWQPFDPGPAQARKAAENGAQLLLSPADRVYLDQKYDASTRLGTDWAAPVRTRDTYGWDPATLLSGVSEDQVLGVEAPLWAETLETYDDVTTMALPRLPAAAEVAWTPRARRGWGGFRTRLAAQTARWDAQGLAYTGEAVPSPGRG